MNEPLSSGRVSGELQADRIGSDMPNDAVPYRSPSVGAILTLCLGALSFLAIFKPVLWVFPLIALVVGFASLRTLANNPLKIGRKAALTGLALACFFFAWGGGHYFSRERALVNQARKFADAWWELIRTKQLRDAHQLHAPITARAKEGETLEEYYDRESGAEGDFTTFFGQPPLSALIKLGPTARPVFQRVGSYDPQLRYDTVALDYQVDFKLNGRSEVLPLRIVMRRNHDTYSGNFNWYVEAVSTPSRGL